MMEKLTEYHEDGDGKRTTLSTDKSMEENVETVPKCLCYICGQVVNSAEETEKYFACVHNLEDNSNPSSRIEIQDDSQMLPIASSHEKSRNRNVAKHLKKLVLICNECGEEFDSKSNISKHLKTAHLIGYKNSYRKSVVCEICSKRILSSSLVKHLKVMHKMPPVEDQIAELRCSICDSGFDDLESIRVHFRLLHRLQVKDTSTFKECKFCGKQISKTNLRKHEKLMHERPRVSNAGGSFFCSGNEKIYIKDNIVKKLQVSTETGNTLNPFEAKYVPKEKKRECYICGKAVSASNFHKHQKYVHNKKKEKRSTKPSQYICDVCKRVFTKRIEMINHFYQAHNASFSYKEPEEIFDVTDEKTNEIQEKYLPDGFEYVEFTKSDDSPNELLLEFKFSLLNKEKLDDWIYHFERKNSTVLTFGDVVLKYKNGNLLKEITYRCVRNSKPRKTTCPRKQHTGCPFRMFISIIKKEICRGGKQPKLLAHVTLRHHHNHQLNRLEWLQYKPPAPKVIEEFCTLFEKGYTVSKALQLYSQKLKMEEKEEMLHVPHFRWLYYHRAKVVKEQYEKMVASKENVGKK